MIYKYLPPERISYLSDALLRFTQPIALNDPYEALPALSTKQTHEVIAKYVANERKKANQAPTKKARQTARQLVDHVKNRIYNEIKANPYLIRDEFFKNAAIKLNSRIGILSLSERWDSGLMWAHYGSSHTGFCVGFDEGHKFFTNPSIGSPFPARSVSYSDLRIQVPLDQNQEIDFEVMFRKSSDWRYEKEIRLLALLENAQKMVQADGWPIYLFEVPHDSIKEVIIGLNSSEQTRSAISKFSIDNKCNLYQAKLSETTFDMIR